jgi:hypothetical protein
VAPAATCVRSSFLSMRTLTHNTELRSIAHGCLVPPGPGSSALGLQAALPRREIETGIASRDTLQRFCGPVGMAGGRKPKEEQLSHGRLFHKGLPMGVK